MSAIDESKASVDTGPGWRWLARLGCFPEEMSRVRWLLLYSWFQGSGLALMRAGSIAVFLEACGAEQLPLLYLCAGVLGILVSASFTRLARSASVGRQLRVLATCIALAIAAAWLGLCFEASTQAAFAAFALLSPLITLTGLQFSLASNRLFEARAARRLFGLLGAGEGLGSLWAYVSVPLLVHLGVPSMHLVGLSALCLGMGALVTRAMTMRFASRLQHPKQPAKTGRSQALAPANQEPKGLKDPYLWGLAAVGLLSMIALYGIDYTFLEALHTRDVPYASFIAGFYGACRVFEFIFRLFFFPWCQREFGLRVTLAILPTLMSGLVLLSIFEWGDGLEEVVELVTVTKLVWEVLRKALFAPAFSILYQAVDRLHRALYQTIADGWARQLGVIASGMMLLYLNSQDAIIDVLDFTYLTLSVLLIWLLITDRLARSYVQRGRAFLDSVRLRSQEALVRSQQALTAAGPATLSGLLELRHGSALDEALTPLRRLTPGQALTHPCRAIVLAACEWCRELGTVDARAQLKQVHTSSADPVIQGAAQQSIDQLRRLQQLETEPELALRHSLSADSQERIEAAWLAGQYEIHQLLRDSDSTGPTKRRERSPMAYVASEILGTLLVDPDLEVRRQALVAAAREPGRRHLSRVIDALDRSDHAPLLAQGLLIGDPQTFDSLERAARAPRVSYSGKLRIVETQAQLSYANDSVKRHGIWLEQLPGVAEVELRHAIIHGLGRLGILAEADELTIVYQELRRSAQRIAVLTASRLDLQRLKASSELRVALDEERRLEVEATHDLLALLLEPELVSVLRFALLGAHPEASHRALELLEDRLPADVAAYTIPLLEELTDAERWHKLEATVAEPRRRPEQRLRHLLARGGAQRSRWTTLCALECATSLPALLKSQEFYAHLAHNDPLLAQSAGQLLWTHAPTAYGQYTARSLEVGESLDALVFQQGGRGPNAQLRTSKAELVRQLASTKLGQQLSWEGRARLLDAGEWQRQRAGRFLPPATISQGRLCLVLSGRLATGVPEERAADTRGVTVDAGESYLRISRENRDWVEDDATILSVDPLRAWEIISRDLRVNEAQRKLVD